MEPPLIESPSHEFRFAGFDLLRLSLPSVVAFAGIIILLHTLDALDWLPSPHPVESSDEVLLRRRVEMTRVSSNAEVLIVGDSSSAVDVEAPFLSSLLPGHPEVLNQGLFMGIGMDIYGETAGRFIKHHPGRVKLVVLLVTAEQLMNTSMSAYHQQRWQTLVATPSESERSRFSDLLARDAVRERIAGGLVPMTMHGHASLFFGYTHHLRRHLPAHGGSMLDHGWYNPAARQTAPAWRITDAVKAEAHQLRSSIPANVALAVGITPMPESHVPAGFRPRRDELLIELNQSLGADFLLTNGPVRLPNGYCASVLHLNPRGQEHFTRLLAVELTRLPVWEQR